MRHRKNNIRMGRKSAHRKATLKSLACALFTRESIRTTKTKAKEAKAFTDKLITIAKDNTPQSKRHIFSLLRDKDLIDILFNEIAPRFKARSSGYSRVIPLYPRRGDGSPMAILELVEKKPKVEPKKTKKEDKPKLLKKTAKPAKAKEEPKKAVKPEPRPEPKVEHKAAPEPKVDIKEEIRKEKAKGEQEKIKKKGLFGNIRKFFRGKAP